MKRKTIKLKQKSSIKKLNEQYRLLIEAYYNSLVNIILWKINDNNT